MKMLSLAAAFLREINALDAKHPHPTTVVLMPSYDDETKMLTLSQGVLFFFATKGKEKVSDEIALMAFNVAVERFFKEPLSQKQLKSLMQIAARGDDVSIAAGHGELIMIYPEGDVWSPAHNCPLRYRDGRWHAHLPNTVFSTVSLREALRLASAFRPNPSN